MFNFMVGSLLLLCSALVSASENYYPIKVIDTFKGRSYTYDVKVTPTEFNNVNEMEKCVKLIRYVTLVSYVSRDITFYPAIKQMLTNCTVNFSCVNKSNNTALEISDSRAEQGLRAGTHQLEAVVFSGKETC